MARTEDDAGTKRNVKAVAFYLPQYHPIPENDMWWGAGFTEWRNVARGRQLFRHHDQPRLPGSLGHYDLRLPDTQQAQADLARAHGVHGFCYYYYWFDGKKLLNQPIEQMLESGKPDFPFCVCWANENWSRNWDGQNRHVLLEQRYTLEGNLAFIREIIPMMRDPRYIRHNGKPVVVVYRISKIPNWRETAAAWREECRRQGVGEIHLCAVRFGLEPLQGHPVLHGLDSYVLFPPHEAERRDIKGEVLDLHRDFHGEIFSYDAVVEGDLARFEEGYPWPVHRGAMMAWDNTARRMTAARIFHGCTPLKFRSWLKGIVEQDARHSHDDEGLMFINAWNEWAEGTVLEPDLRYGTAYLEAVKSVIGVQKHGSSEGLPVSRHAASGPGARAQKVIDALKWDSERPRGRIAGGRSKKEGRPTVLLSAHISGHQLYGGERSFLDLLRAFHSLDYNVVTALPSDNNSAYVEEIAALSIATYIVPFAQWRDQRAPLERLVLAYSRILLEHGVDVVHANTIVQIEPLIAARRLNRLAVVHVRELVTLDTSICEQIGLPPAEIVAEVFERSDHVIANSEATLQAFRRPGRTWLVPNAVDLGAFAEIDQAAGDTSRPLRFGIVSSNIPKKGVGDVIEVARRLGDRDDLEFVIIGPQTADTEAWAAEITHGRLPGTVRFAGYKDTPAEAMAELDVLLNLSQFTESFGRTVAEAAAAGRPAIAYCWGALPELIEDGVTGRLAAYRDIDAVAASVADFAADPDRIREMGQKARARIAERNALPALSARLGDAYASMLGGRESHRPADFSPAIVIPVYNALEEFRDCVSGLVANTPLDRVKVVIVHDASTDPEVGEFVRVASEEHGFTLIENPENLGYTKSVNIGVRAAGDRDVVLLNSDATPTADWLDGLWLAAYMDDRTGTVTAMSDNAGAFSFPVQGEHNPRPEWWDRDAFPKAIVQAAGGHLPVDVPTGSGFCMYIRRALIEDIGLFDEEAFPRGYGEENDFCMRARAAGWRNVITPWSYVYHARSASFREAKAELVKRGVEEVIRRHQSYVDEVSLAFKAPAMLSLRSALSLSSG